jgi:hypothetical protein
VVRPGVTKSAHQDDEIAATILVTAGADAKSSAGLVNARNARRMPVPSDEPTTGWTRHILSPIPRPGGRMPLCGAEDWENTSYGGLDEAYRANVEGWPARGAPCRDCLKVATIAMGVINC